VDQTEYSYIIKDLTARALWEVENIIKCIPEVCWEKHYYTQPVWKHVYHMLHSLDQWLINPYRFNEPAIHEEGLNNLDVPSCKILTRGEIMDYFSGTKTKILDYLSKLRDEELLKYPEGCGYTRFTLILAQHRHLHTHMGMLMGFIVSETGKWPAVLGLTGVMPAGESPSGTYEG
jgi:hypothetical protein